MGKDNKLNRRTKRKNEASGKKEIPIGIQLILILLGASLFILFCVGTGVMIDAIVAIILEGTNLDGFENYIWRIVPVGIAHIFFFIAFCLDGIPGLKKSKGESFREDILGMFLIVMGFSSVVLMALAAKYDRDIDGIIAMLILPAIGIVITPKWVKTAVKKIDKWEDSQKSKTHFKDDEFFYRLKTPVSFEKRLYFEVFKNQFKFLFIGFGVVLLLIVIVLHVFSGDSIPSEKISDGGALFALVAFFGIAIFGIPLFAVFMTNSICKLRIVKKHKYQAFHIIAKRADDKKLIVERGTNIQSYEYPICVGIRKKDVKDTRATMIIMPDMVMVFPDKVPVT